VRLWRRGGSCRRPLSELSELREETWRVLSSRAFFADMILVVWEREGMCTNIVENNYAFL